MSDAKKVIVNNSPAIVRLNNTLTTTAGNVYLADEGNYYDSKNVEGALQEVGQNLAGDYNELEPVISQLADPPVSPAVDDRYLVTSPATGAWLGQEDSIAEWNGASWDFTAPATDDVVYVTSTLTTLRYNDTAWVEFLGIAVLQNGNAVGAGGLVVGATTERALRFITNNTQRMFIRPAGNVGIGTAFPDSDADSLLTVNGDLKSKEYVSEYQTLTFASPQTSWDLSGGQVGTLTITAGTELTVSNIQSSTIVLEVIQDVTGGHTLTFDSSAFGEVDQSNVATDAGSITNYVMILGSDGKYRGTGKTFAT